jgi:hypothetical protein
VGLPESGGRGPAGREPGPAGRGAAQILERGLRNEIEINGFGEALGQAVLDYLLPGRGQVWVRYEPEVQEGVSIPVESEMDLRDARGQIGEEDDSESEQKFRDTGDRVIRESTPVDYINWADFYTFPSKARVWREVVGEEPEAAPPNRPDWAEVGGEETLWAAARRWRAWRCSCSAASG